MLLQHLAKLNRYFFPFTKVSGGNFIFKCVQHYDADLATESLFLSKCICGFPGQTKRSHFLWTAQEESRIPLQSRHSLSLRTTWSFDASICKLELYLWFLSLSRLKWKQQNTILRVVPNQFMALPGTTQLYTITPFCKINAEVFK